MLIIFTTLISTFNTQHKSREPREICLSITDPCLRKPLKKEIIDEIICQGEGKKQSKTITTIFATLLRSKGFSPLDTAKDHFSELINQREVEKKSS